ncbi:ribosomal protein L4 [Euphorbia peplus]|nr:ribosomal protein L4 [Euphorbia peplus]
MAASTIRTPSPTSLSFFSSSIFHIPKPLSLSFPKPHSLNPHFKSLSISSQAATLPILSFSGEVIGETHLNLKSAPPETARAVVHRAIITDQQNKRRGTASTLTRAEVRGGGKKPYQQKATGRARRGSTRTPLRPGGGVIFGPKPRDWTIKINRKEKKLGISTALWSAVENMICVEEFGGKFEKPKTKDFIDALRRWGMEPSEKVMFLMMDVDENVGKSSRNLRGLRMLTPRSLNMFDILNSDKLVLTPDTVDFLNGRYGVDVQEDEDEEDGAEDGDGESEGDENVVAPE